MNHKNNTTRDVAARERLGLATQGVTVPSSKGGGGHKLCDNCTCATCAKWLDGAITTQWGDSEAKKFIRQCLEGDANYPYWVMMPGEVYQSNQLLFHQFKYTTFWTNLNTLKKSIKADRGQVEFEELAIKMEALTFKRGKVTSHGNPFYDTSVARESLVKDVNDGTAAKYKNKPREL
jgi:hypothetical protein